LINPAPNTTAKAGGIAGTTLGKLREIEKQLKTMSDEAVLKGEGLI